MENKLKNFIDPLLFIDFFGEDLENLARLTDFLNSCFSEYEENKLKLNNAIYLNVDQNPSEILDRAVSFVFTAKNENDGKTNYIEVQLINSISESFNERVLHYYNVNALKVWEEDIENYRPELSPYRLINIINCDTSISDNIINRYQFKEITTGKVGYEAFDLWFINVANWLKKVPSIKRGEFSRFDEWLNMLTQTYSEQIFKIVKINPQGDKTVINPLSFSKSQ